jgi:uncharacterized protein
LIINLKSLKQGRTILELTVPGNEIDLRDTNFRIPGDVRAEAEISKSSDNIELKLDLSFYLEAPCDRCLEPCASPRRETGAYFIKMGKEAVKPEKNLSKDQENVLTHYTTEEEVDLANFVRETVLLSLPMKWLCSEECKGLCPVCGQNLNVKDCGHRTEKTDSRWKKLLEMGQQSSE